MPNDAVQAAAVVLAFQRLMRWLKRALRRHPLIALPGIWFVLTCCHYLVLNYVVPGEPPKPSPVWWLVVLFAPAWLPGALSGFLLWFGAWSEADSLANKAGLIAVL